MVGAHLEIDVTMIASGRSLIIAVPNAGVVFLSLNGSDSMALVDLMLIPDHPQNINTSWHVSGQ